MPLPLRPRRFFIAPPARLAAGLLALWAVAAGARAQDLQTLYDAAREYDATFQSARANAEAARYRADQAQALWLPTIALQAGVARNESDTPYASTRSANSTTRQAGLVAQQNLFNGANSATVEQARRSVEIADVPLRAAEQDLIVRLSQAYFDVLSATDTLNTVQAGQKAISEQLASAKRAFEVGTATITDTREAQARFDLTSAQALAAENDLRVKKLALEQMVGRSGVQPQPLIMPFNLPAPQPQALEPWLEQADARNPNVQLARLAQDIAKLETDKARAGHWPTLALTGAYTKSHTSVDGNALTPVNTVAPYSASGNGTNANIGLTLNMPLFAGMAVQNRIKETLALETKAASDLETARRAVAQGARQAYFGVQSGQAQVKALEAAEASSKLALEATQLGYKVGVRVNLDVLNAQTQLYQTQRDLAKARYDLLMAQLKLKQVAGNLDPQEIQQLNRWLASSNS